MPDAGQSAGTAPPDNARMATEAESLLHDLQRYRFLLHNFREDERLARALLQLISETELRLRELGIEDIPL
jgi:hypothetical protein